MRKLLQKLGELNSYSKTSIKMGALMMLSFYIVGLVAYIIAPDVPNYFGAMSVFRGSMEAAPASLVSGICAAVICDIALASKKSGGKPWDK